MRLTDPALVDLLRLAYPAEKAAAFAYVGHAKSLKHLAHKKAVKQIEIDEWEHRLEVLKLMRQYGVEVSLWYELRFHVIGKIIGLACFFIGWFMPHYFAGRLESGNTCEYIVMLRRFHALGIYEHDEILYAMAVKEKEHEVFFLNVISRSPLLRIFEPLFSWGKRHSANDIDLERLKALPEAEQYCSD